MNTPRTPAVAVAAGPCVYVYRNLRPYFKFTVPNVDIMAAEQEVWDQLKLGAVDAARAFEALTNARFVYRVKLRCPFPMETVLMLLCSDSGLQLSARSRDFLAIEDPVARDAFVGTHRNSPLKQLTVITCMETLCKSIEGDQTVSGIVVGTEAKEVLILNPAGSAIVAKVTLASVPVFMAISGTLDVEYRIVVACRDNNVYTIKVCCTSTRLGSVVSCGVIVDRTAL
jgi:Bardet-Biedl syndrome 1 protein